ncbi:hypothetical protein B0T14DRAFT_531070, partial [Immersiella caudata]
MRMGYMGFSGFLSLLRCSLSSFWASSSLASGRSFFFTGFSDLSFLHSSGDMACFFLMGTTSSVRLELSNRQTAWIRL